MAMEMHELQKRATDAAVGVASLNRQITQLSTEIAGKTDIPADVKTAFESLKADAAAMAPKLPVAAAGGGRGGGGGGRGGADPTITGKIGQAKNGLSAHPVADLDHDEGVHRRQGGWPKALSDANALFAKAAAVSASLAKFNLKLDPPKPVDTGTAKKKTTI